MFSDVKNELQYVAGMLNEAIRKDTFPETIYPEELRLAVRTYPEQGGKRIRPALLLWACGLFGGDILKALPAAQAVEIFHNWTLVHDDIIDSDALRRGKPTTHVEIARYASSKLNTAADKAEKFGTDLAILAGDAQQAWAVNSMLKLAENGIDPALVIALTRRMQEVLNRQLISGEALDVELALQDPASVQAKDVYRMISGKTSVLLAFCLQCGAAIARNKSDFDSEEQKLLAEFAENLGLAYQLEDDLLGVYGEIEEFGKPLCSDFQERKPTLLYLEAKKRLSGDDAVRLDALTGLPFYSMEIVQLLRRLLTDCGAEQAIRELSSSATAKALDALQKLPDNEYRERLAALAGYLLRRKI
ncbi:MAG: polyprenyl synthetase family protein [Lentisphaeria bacterium]|nr:polyprenyl synthetase family protein [Lentisphaeria bacterium]